MAIVRITSMIDGVTKSEELRTSLNGLKAHLDDTVAGETFEEYIKNVNAEYKRCFSMSPNPKIQKWSIVTELLNKEV